MVNGDSRSKAVNSFLDKYPINNGDEGGLSTNKGMLVHLYYWLKFGTLLRKLKLIMK